MGTTRRGFLLGGTAAIAAACMRRQETMPASRDQPRRPTTVPLRYDASGCLLIEVAIERRPKKRLLFDTGASCSTLARAYVAEIGLVGDSVDRYQLWLGGDSAGTRLATPVAEGVHKTDLIDLLNPVLARYHDERKEGEAFGDWIARAGITQLEYANAPRRAAARPRQEPA